MPSRDTRPKRPDDKRLKANRPPERQAKPRVKSRMQQLIDGDIDFKDLDEEELKRGQVRGSDGKFRGTARKDIPRRIMVGMQQEWRDRAIVELQKDQEIARNALREILQDKRAAAQARVNAAAILFDRNLGKVVDKVEATTIVKKYEEMGEEVFVEVDIDPPEDELASRREERDSA